MGRTKPSLVMALMVALTGAVLAGCGGASAPADGAKLGPFARYVPADATFYSQSDRLSPEWAALDGFNARLLGGQTPPGFFTDVASAGRYALAPPASESPQGIQFGSHVASAAVRTESGLQWIRYYEVINGRQIFAANSGGQAAAVVGDFQVGPGFATSARALIVTQDPDLLQRALAVAAPGKASLADDPSAQKALSRLERATAVQGFMRRGHLGKPARPDRLSGQSAFDALVGPGDIGFTMSAWSGGIDFRAVSTVAGELSSKRHSFDSKGFADLATRSMAAGKIRDAGKIITTIEDLGAGPWPGEKLISREGQDNLLRGETTINQGADGLTIDFRPMNVNRARDDVRRLIDSPVSVDYYLDRLEGSYSLREEGGGVQVSRQTGAEGVGGSGATPDFLAAANIPSKVSLIAYLNVGAFSSLRGSAFAERFANTPFGLGSTPGWPENASQVLAWVTPTRGGQEFRMFAEVPSEGGE